MTRGRRLQFKRIWFLFCFSDEVPRTHTGERRSAVARLSNESIVGAGRHGAHRLRREWNRVERRCGRYAVDSIVECRRTLRWWGSIGLGIPEF